MDDQLETNAFEESDPLFENNGTKKPNSSLDTAEQDEAPHKNKHLCVHYENENECENVIVSSVISMTNLKLTFDRYDYYYVSLG